MSRTAKILTIRTTLTTTAGDKLSAGILSRLAVLMLLFFTLWPAQSSQAREGFGLKKSLIQLERVRPADVQIQGDAIDVQADKGSGNSALEQQLVTSLKNTLLGNESRFRLERDVPDALIEVSLVDSDFQERWETRTVKRPQPAGKDSKGRQQYVMRDTRVRFKIISHVFAVSYRVTNKHSDTVLVAGNANRQFDEDFEDGRNAPSRSQLDSNAVTEVCHEVARRITPTSETIGVLLPGGSLKDLRNLAKGGLWNEYLEGLSSLTPKSKAKDDAYRLYALGVAFEAVAYQSESPQVSINYLQEAAAHYKKAIQLNPGEKYFTRPFDGNMLMKKVKKSIADVRGKKGEIQHKQAMAPTDRVASALQQFQKIIEHGQSAGATAVDRVASSSNRNQARGAKNLRDDPPMTNRDVIKMTRSNLSDDIIVTAIQGAKATDFDTSIRGLSELGQAKVSTRIIQLIQEVGGRRR